MARPLSWLPRLAEIRRCVERSLREQYDRAAIEKLFQIQPRAAGKLLQMLPQVQVPGKARVVERAVLVRFLESVRQADDVAGVFGAMREAKPKVKRTIRARRLPDGFLELCEPLPRHVAMSLTRGKLEISFRSVEDLMRAQVAVLMKLHADEEEFEREFCIEDPEKAEARERRDQMAAEAQEFTAEMRRLDEQVRAWIAGKRDTKNCSLAEPCKSKVEGYAFESPTLRQID